MKRADLCRARRVEQPRRAAHVGVDGAVRRQDAAIDVRFGGEVHYGVEAGAVEDLVHRLLVADVAAHELVPGVLLNGSQVLQVPGVGERVERDDVRVGTMGEDEADEGRADEPGAAGHEKFHSITFVNFHSPVMRARCLRGRRRGRRSTGRTSVRANRCRRRGSAPDSSGQGES